ncbi:uncharacterized protein LOC116849269 [Odontomachus brunneus]|uniref:uncharacterized protein LOC116849269 n=1 Tax=Odontomachus brunneus TaxID=486640 RepID=UPI0013F27FC3|nr:uncharacterized protein LOC116849269 [Odontomachus brunneus]XP_032682125.1 uncharacterized protein LOC116849269 [Odontomachus brunneus]XP_032682126.1 uncharacterized protein LOC116849269 [Odontomachus brunneus]
MFLNTKRNKASNVQPEHKSKKRIFYGNRHTNETEVSFASTSAKKLKNKDDFEITIDAMNGYRIIHFMFVFNILKTLLKCKKCDSDVHFYVRGEQGLGFKIIVDCDCDLTEIDSCPKINNKSFEINRRMVFAMRLIGVGLQGINTFCGLMDLGQGLATNVYYACLENIWTASKAVFDTVILKAASEEKEKNTEAENESLGLTVSGDVTWSKRGYSSLFEVVTLIGKYSDKIVDLIVKSTFCQACNDWQKKNDEEFEAWYGGHKKHCVSNHTGSAGKMDGVIEMFARSETLHEVKYINYIGDTKTFKALLDSKPYGDELPITKEEYFGHVKKRMDFRLRAAKRNNKRLCGNGPGKLTDALINDLSTYYSMAIIHNSDSVDAMKDAIWATFYHKCSTDENPQHDKCPPGESSWCKWKQAEANNVLEYEHPAPLTLQVQEVIRSIYEDLSSDDLLKRYVDGYTQNNECFNSLIWSFAPKHIFCTRKTIEIASFLAACIFNEGFNSVLRIMEAMGIKIGMNASIMATREDNKRRRNADKRALQASSICPSVGDCNKKRAE